MSTQKQKNQRVRKLIRMGSGRGSLGLTLPILLVESLGWREKQRVVVKKVGGKLVIYDERKRK